ncbi:LPP20 family lipoprotein [Shewanella pealeana]
MLGCQSTKTPDWYNLPISNNSDYITAVGEGRSLEQAKKSALSNINAALWTQVNSSFSMNDTHRSINDKNYSNAYVNNAINTKTANIAFSGVEYINIANNDTHFYAQAQINKSNIISQLTSDLRNINQKAEAQVDKLAYQDALQWWLVNKDSAIYNDYTHVRLAILSSLSPAHGINTQSLDKLNSLSARVKSNILIHIQTSKSDKKMAQIIADKLSNEGIKTTMHSTSTVTHNLKLISDLRQSIMAEAYISTKITALQLKDRNNNIISSSEIISTGNSLSNYQISKEGAERHFSTLVDERGLWPALGLTL